MIDNKIIGRFRLIGIPQGHIVVDDIKYLKNLKWFDVGISEEEIEVSMDRPFYLLEN